MNWNKVGIWLPDNNVNVLVYTHNGVEISLFYNGYFSYFNGDIIDGITHWMPLPEPPKD